jgi:hypothetical protein
MRLTTKIGTGLIGAAVISLSFQLANDKLKEHLQSPLDNDLDAYYEKHRACANKFSENANGTPSAIFSQSANYCTGLVNAQYNRDDPSMSLKTNLNYDSEGKLEQSYGLTPQPEN